MLYSFVFHCDFSNPNRITKLKQIGILLAQMPFFVVLRRLRKCIYLKKVDSQQRVNDGL